MKKVLVAMSGGVDSSMAAYFLKQQGYKVAGLFVFFFKNEKSQAGYESAKSVADFLNIELKTLDVSEKFNSEIIQNFIQEYKKGNTPNPCICCNKYFKFGRLLSYVLQNGFDYLATGHYCKRQETRDKEQGKKYKLITAKDKSKDQVYFLYNLNQKILPHVLFPLGKYYKSDVKKLAQEIKLPVKQSKESNDVCFIPNQNTQKFLKQNIQSRPGNILNTKNEKIGEHQGLEFYTIGQRQGINIGGIGPYYVIKKDFDKNELIVTNNKNDSQLFSKKLKVKDINWVLEKPKFPLRCFAQHRYQTKMEKVKIYKKENKYLIKYKKPQRAVTPGQSIVFYKPVKKFFNQDFQDFEILGGAIIH